MSDLDDLYSAEWFAHDFEHLQPEFNIAADALVELFKPQTAFDVGAGPGMVVRRLRQLGVDACGVDGSRHALEYADPATRPHLALFDLRTWINEELSPSGPVDLVVCTEVAEHIPAEHADRLVDFLLWHVKSEGGAVVFTAAPPGQGGHGHFNEQPREYWIEKFAEQGVAVDADATKALVEAWAPLKRLSHMPRNVMVLK